MDGILGSYIWRNRIEAAWMFVTICGSLLALHVFTDFNVLRHDWWFYLVQVAVRETGINKIPLPYAWFFAGGVAVYFSGVFVFRFLLKVKIYGYARVATKSDIRKMGITDNKGQVLGVSHNVLMKSRKIAHTQVVAGTGGGKTQGYSIPTTFEYEGSMVIVDPEGELWEKTSGKRSETTDCYRLEYVKGEGETARNNPISAKVMPEDMGEVERRVAQLARIISPSAKDFWDKGGVKIGNGLLLLEIFDARHEGREPLITNVAHWSGDFRGISEDDEDPIKTKLKRAAKRAEDRGYPKQLVTTLNDLAGTPYRQRYGIFESFNVEMEPFRAGSVEYSLSDCDFTWRTLVDGERPATVYLVFSLNDREFVSSMMTILISNLIFSLISRPLAECERQRSVFFLIEEFSALKKAEAIKEIFDRGRKKNVHAGIVVQNLSQIEEIYSKEELRTFTNSTEYTIAFTSNDRSLHERFSHMSGQTTRRRESQSDGGRSDSVSQGYEGRALVLPQQWGEIEFGQHRLLVEGHLTRPVFCKTPLAYKNAKMEKWMQIPPPPPVPGQGERS